MGFSSFFLPSTTWPGSLRQSSAPGSQRLGRKTGVWAQSQKTNAEPESFSAREKHILKGYQTILRNQQGDQAVSSQLQQLNKIHINSPMAEKAPLTSQWGDHVSVLASVSQRHLGYVRFEKGLNRYTTTSYKDGLLKLLLKPGIRSLREAHDRLEREGYPSHQGLTQYAVSTCGTLHTSCLDGWKKDVPKNRFVLLMGYAPYREPGEKFGDGLQQSAYVLNQAFNVPYSQMMLCPSVTKVKIQKQLQKLGARLEAAAQTQQPLEILISYDGHGAYEGFPKLSSIYHLKEGEAQGYVLMADKQPLSQSELRDMMRQLLPPVDTTLIINACHSGSWIA